MRNIYTCLKGIVLASMLFIQTESKAQLTENFDDITTLTGNGWFMQNNSTPIGGTNWFQGNAVVFPAFNGAGNSYIGANFNNVTGANTISNWLVTPNFTTIKNGDQITFYTRTTIDNMWADRLQLRLSTNGASTNVGVGSAAVGDFTTILLDINPTLALSVYPMAWTQFTVTVSGLPAPVSGRFAFRYFVTNGGPLGANSDYIGIDNFVYTPYVCPVLSVTPASLPNGTAGASYSFFLNQTGALGTPSYAVTAGALPPGLSLTTGGNITGTPNATGTYNFTVTVSDASGCFGSSAYSITIDCPTNGASLSAFPSLCLNGTGYTLVQGSPAGGTYSGTGVTGSVFDPSVGTQTITYNLIDAYACPQTTNAVITVNTPPVVSQSSLSDVCDNVGSFALSGGSPAGGTYSGTGVTAGSFNPTVGTQTITYSFTDANNCTSTAATVQTVLASPAVTLAPISGVCVGASPFVLTGGSPAGGTYSGTGVTAGSFDPAAGTQVITYTFTDVNTCIGTDMQTVTVNPLPTVSITPFSDACSNAAPFVLTNGTPAGGTYSGTGVTAGSFDPSVGTQTITYTFTDANGCTNDASATINVVSALTVTLNLSPICDNVGVIVLTGGSPAGGTYSGTGVTGGSFDPSVGTQTITYTFTDANGCSGTDVEVLTVNTTPVVTLAPFTTVLCQGAGLFNLTGGSPAGGTYSGVGVSGTTFNPTTAGTFSITYTVTNSGCTGSDTENIIVDPCVGVSSEELNSNLNCYPNPNNGMFTLEFSQEGLNDLEMTIVSLDGKIILSESRSDLTGVYTRYIDMSAEAAGFYLIKIKSGSAEFTKTIVIK